MQKSKIIMLATASLCLCLAGCGSQNKTTNKQSSKSSSLASSQSTKKGSASDNSNSQSTGKYGNQGPFNVPSNMQGTWYSKNGQITIGAHSMTINGNKMHLYKQSADFAYDKDSYKTKTATKATQKWYRATELDENGLHWINVKTWMQSAGNGNYYSVHTETIDGHKVQILVAASGTDTWTDDVYYRSQSMAQQNADRHFDDLHYRNDD